MGHDIYPIGRHSLDTTSIETFAREFAQRMNVNVEYGYQDICRYNVETGVNEASFDFMTLGYITVADADAETTLFIFDDYYQSHRLLDLFGDKLSEQSPKPPFDSLARQYHQDKDEICYRIFERDKDKEWGQAYADTIECNRYYLCRWWDLCRYFTVYDIYFKEFDTLNAYRTNLMRFFAKLGGHQMVYVDDQGHMSQDLAYNGYKWDHLLSECRTRFGNKFLHIPQFMEHKQLLPDNDYPLAFYDDFKDLRR